MHSKLTQRCPGRGWKGEGGRGREEQKKVVVAAEARGEQKGRREDENVNEEKDKNEDAREKMREVEEDGRMASKHYNKRPL